MHILSRISVGWGALVPVRDIVVGVWQSALQGDMDVVMAFDEWLS